MIKMADKHFAFVFNVPPPVEPAGNIHRFVVGLGGLTDRTYGITFLYS